MSLAGRITSFALCMSTLLGVCSAHAQQPDVAEDAHETTGLSRPGLRLELLGGAGFGDVKIQTGETINGYGGAVSLRAAWVFPFAGFVALRFDQFAGTSSMYNYPNVGSFRRHAGATFLGGELGFEIALPHAFVRPNVGLGLLLARRDVTCTQSGPNYAALYRQACDDAQSAERAAASNHFAAVPALTMGLRTTRFSFMLEPRFYIVQDANAYALFGGVGLLL